MYNGTSSSMSMFVVKVPLYISALFALTGSCGLHLREYKYVILLSKCFAHENS